MKFHTPLREALFLRRKSINIIEANADGVPLNLLCPNDSSLENFALVGSRIWYSPEKHLPFYCPAIWQIVESDYGNLSCVNSNLCADLFLEAIGDKIIQIPGFDEGTINLIREPSLPGGHAYDINLNKEDENCFIVIDSSSFNLDKQKNNTNYYPESTYLESNESLYSLIHAKMTGHRAILCSLIFSEGVDEICLTDLYAYERAKLLFRALELGVEFLAYSTKIGTNLDTIEVIKQAKVVTSKQIC